MMDTDAKARIQNASVCIDTAVRVLRMEMPTIQAFLKECRDMESFGSIINPTLYRDPERKAVSALLEPMFKAAVDFVRTFDEQQKRAIEALAKVKAG